MNTVPLATHGEDNPGCAFSWVLSISGPQNGQAASSGFPAQSPEALHACRWLCSGGKALLRTHLYAFPPNKLTRRERPSTLEIKIFLPVQFSGLSIKSYKERESSFKLIKHKDHTWALLKFSSISVAKRMWRHFFFFASKAWSLDWIQKEIKCQLFLKISAFPMSHVFFFWFKLFLKM